MTEWPCGQPRTTTYKMIADRNVSLCEIADATMQASAPAAIALGGSEVYVVGWPGVDSGNSALQFRRPYVQAQKQRMGIPG